MQLKIKELGYQSGMDLLTSGAGESFIGRG